LLFRGSNGARGSPGLGQCFTPCFPPTPHRSTRKSWPSRPSRPLRGLETRVTASLSRQCRRRPTPLMVCGGGPVVRRENPLVPLPSVPLSHHQRWGRALLSSLRPYPKQQDRVTVGAKLTMKLEWQKPGLAATVVRPPVASRVDSYGLVVATVVHGREGTVMSVMIYTQVSE
jgi:hypothetical protein